MLFGPPLRRGSSEDHLRQVRWCHRFLWNAKNSRRAPGSQPGDYLDKLLGLMVEATADNRGCPHNRKAYGSLYGPLLWEG